ncbi:UNVERIFIED_CONTAM: hypothetical protein FKN15_037593 [Acipenser sinensis]
MSHYLTYLIVRNKRECDLRGMTYSLSRRDRGRHSPEWPMVVGHLRIERELSTTQ